MHPTPDNENVSVEQIYADLSRACGDDPDAPPPTLDEIIMQHDRDEAERRAWWRARRPRLVVDNAPDVPQTDAAFLAARAAVAARRRDLAAGIAARGDGDATP